MVHSWDFDAVTYEGAVYCVVCCPVPLNDEEVSPIFADSEWDYVPVCDACGQEHTYMSIIEEE